MKHAGGLTFWPVPFFTYCGNFLACPFFYFFYESFNDKPQRIQ